VAKQSAGTSYEIRVEGVLSDQWSDWLGGLTISPCDDRATLIAGKVPDQAALFGILAQLHALNVALIGVRRLPDSACGCAPQADPLLEHTG
jgi:hypothetical protein